MSKVYLISDLHLGHKNIANHRKCVSSEEENYWILRDNWHKVVTKRDTVYMLGDVCFTEDRLRDLSGWAGRKILIAGNHCTDGIPMKTICEYYDAVYSLHRYKKAWLSHAPLHQDELRGRVCIHGHTHYHQIDDPRYLNVCVEHTEMHPVSFEIVREVFKTRGIEI